MTGHSKTTAARALAAVMIGIQAASLHASSDHTAVPPSPAGEIQRLVSGNHELAFDLYHRLRHQDGNLLFSPLSIAQALAMTYAGARGPTGEQMARTLHFDQSGAGLHRDFAALTRELRSSTDSSTMLRIANALWVDRGLQVVPEFQQLINQYYGGALQRADFQTGTEQARDVINRWISEHTAGKIPELFGPGTLTVDTRLVLANAVYFKADWTKQFDPRQTRPAPFHLLEERTVEVPMMAQMEKFPFASQPGVQVIAMPYGGADFSMVAVLPDAGQFAEFEATMTADSIVAILSALRSTRVYLRLPRFEFNFKVPLDPALGSLGMSAAFDAQQADFSGIDDRRDLHIDAVLHEAYIKVDESGTEAAASTGVSIGTTSVPPSIVFDRPFVFLIRDNTTGAILFLGRITNPA